MRNAPHPHDPTSRAEHSQELADDTAQIDVPDTPAPVFAVRALKTALFGTPAPKDRRPASKPSNDKPTQPTAIPTQPSDKSPVKPTGILLTPGTGTTRRKRVSFNHDVKAGSRGAAATSASGLPDECPGKFPSPWGERTQDGEKPRPKTRLQQAMESSRKGNAKGNGTAEKDLAHTAKDSEDAWEEVDDDDSEFEADITMDLNEPHSRSGKYWKSYFETYHSDAKVEMEKLVKYKHLAKSYAKMKDAEALELNQKLKEEQEKVKAMEEKVAEMARQAASAARQRGGASDPLLMRELEEQTALATEYKKQVEELESLLQVNFDEAGDGNHGHRRTASPRTQRTLMETQRELRRARSQVRELDKLQEERDRLRSDLKFAEQRSSKLAEENRRLTRELSQNASKVQDLEKRLEDTKGSYEKLKGDAKARYSEAQQVLHKKNDRIRELREEIELLRSTGAEATRPARSARAKGTEEKDVDLRPLEPIDKGRTAPPRKELEEIKRISSQDDPALTRPRDKRSLALRKRASDTDATLAQSRALREKLEAELSAKASLPASAVFGDRGNLQDSQSSASSGRSAHVRDNQRYSSRTEGPSARTTRAATSSAEKLTLDALLAETREKRVRTVSSEQQVQQQHEAMKKPPLRPLSERDGAASEDGDLAQRNGLRVGSGEGHSMVNSSRAALPAHRKAAALARLQRKKAERATQLRLLLEQDTENPEP